VVANPQPGPGRELVLVHAVPDQQLHPQTPGWHAYTFEWSQRAELAVLGRKPGRELDGPDLALPSRVEQAEDFDVPGDPELLHGVDHHRLVVCQPQHLQPVGEDAAADLLWIEVGDMPRRNIQRTVGRFLRSGRGGQAAGQRGEEDCEAQQRGGVARRKPLQVSHPLSLVPGT
jgi:hypothetical protein